MVCNYVCQIWHGKAVQPVGSNMGEPGRYDKADNCCLGGGSTYECGMEGKTTCGKQNAAAPATVRGATRWASSTVFFCLNFVLVAGGGGARLPWAPGARGGGVHAGQFAGARRMREHLLQQGEPPDRPRTQLYLRPDFGVVVTFQGWGLWGRGVDCWCAVVSRTH
jgi:hypothetical protein